MSRRFATLGDAGLMKKNKTVRGSLLLMLGAVVWGFAFAFQRSGMDYMPPVSFNGIRNMMAGLCLCLVVRIMDRKMPGRPRPSTPEQKKAQLQGGVLCGVLLFLASTLQQIGLVETTAGKAGFITALYVVLVPIAGALFFHRRVGRMICVSVALAVVGLFLLCVPAGEVFSISRGDALILACAVCFTGQILTVDSFSPRVDCIRLSRDEFLICGTLGVLVSLFTETITWDGFRQALPAMLYAGIISGALGYTLQILGQRDVNPTVASLLMCLESVFSVISGALLLGERITPRESLGCVVMFAAVILAQISPLLRLQKKRRSEA